MLSGEDTRTTVMLRHVPNRYTQQKLLVFIERAVGVGARAHSLALLDETRWRHRAQCDTVADARHHLTIVIFRRV